MTQLPYRASQPASSTGEGYPIPKLLIAIIAFAAPVLGGAVLHYAWRGRYPAAAAFARSYAWASFGALAAILVLRGALAHHAASRRSAPSDAPSVTAPR